MELIRFACNLNLLKNNPKKITEKEEKTKKKRRRGKKTISFQMTRIQSFEVVTNRKVDSANSSSKASRRAGRIPCFSARKRQTATLP
jgi:hypothetical protein